MLLKCVFSLKNNKFEVEVKSFKLGENVPFLSINFQEAFCTLQTTKFIWIHPVYLSNILNYISKISKVYEYELKFHK